MLFLYKTPHHNSGLCIERNVTQQWVLTTMRIFTSIILSCLRNCSSIVQFPKSSPCFQTNGFISLPLEEGYLRSEKAKGHPCLYCLGFGPRGLPLQEITVMNYCLMNHSVNHPLEMEKEMIHHYWPLPLKSKAKQNTYVSINGAK